MKNRIAALVVLACILLALLPAPVRADVAPPPIPLVGGVGPFEYQDTNVQMVSERVEMELTPQPAEDEEIHFSIHLVEVNAWFVMRNTGSQDETMQVVFPLADMNCYKYPQDLNLAPSYTYAFFSDNGFQAFVNGVSADVSTITTPLPCHPDDSELNWAAFDVTFPVGQDVLIRVTYLIEQRGNEEVLNVGYTLETGAAWKGPIEEAIIVFRFPFVVESFIIPGTTPGYRIMQNEIYWRYENFEPDSSDNINVSFISPTTWAAIQDSRARIRSNPKDDTAWATLADSYYGISHFHGPNVRSAEYAQRVHDTYRDGLKENPESAAINAGYAELLLIECCTYTMDQFSDSNWAEIRPYLQKALEADPSNQKALYVFGAIENNYPNVDITVGPTFTPTVTRIPTRTKTPTQTKKPYFTKSPTLTTTWTPRPTQTSRYTKTPTPTSSYTAAPPTRTMTPIVQGEQATVTESNRTNWWERAALVASGFVIGIAWMWVWKRQSRAR